MIRKIKTNSREEWLALRHKYIGGSDCAALVGMNKFASPYSVWAEKTDQVDPFKGNLATRTGEFLEPFVATLWSEQTGKKVHNDNLSFLNDQFPWAIANIDRKVEGESAGLECKTCSELRMKEFSDGEFPENYYAQCVHYLAVTGYQKWYLAVLVGNRTFLTFEIERNEEEIQRLMAEEERFWNTYVIPRKAPPADGSEATGKTIRDIYPESSKMELDMTGLEGMFIDYFRLQEEIDDCKTQKDRIAQSIQQLMGPAERGTCGIYTVTWAMQNSAGLDREAMKRDFPSLDFEKYRKPKNRVFKVTKRKTA